ncbi:MAG: hypothetical protein M0Q40_12040 [Limnochordia bacterium]|nr:hypothetical protein [Limnochordia bacterium]
MKMLQYGIVVLVSLLTCGIVYAQDMDLPTNNLQLWLKADAGVISRNNLVSIWEDQSGNGRHAMSKTGKEPSFDLKGINGHPSIRFDGGNTFLRVAHDDVLNPVEGFTVFIVYQYESGFRLLQKKSNADGISVDGWFVTPLGGLGVAGSWDRAHHFSSDTPYISSYSYDPVDGEIRLYGNGVLRNVIKDVLSSEGNSDDLFIGKRDWASRTEGHLCGLIAEILIYNARLSDLERGQVEEYLKSKYMSKHELSSDTSISPDPLWVSEVKYQDPTTNIYLGSPSLIRLKNGDIIATHDYFGPGASKNWLGLPNMTSVYRSTDDGENWMHLTDLIGVYWASLFEHNGALYLLGTSAGPGSIVIVRSTDGGITWTEPVDGKNGLLFPGGQWGTPPRYHGAPTPVLEVGGRLYRAFENAADPTMPGFSDYQALVISANSNADLLDAGNWTISNQLVFNQSWDPPGSAPTTGWAEGNIVEGPDGRLWNILRVNSTPYVDRAAMIEIHEEGSLITFTPDDFIKFPGAQSKFVIRRDESTGLYWTLTNENTDPSYSSQRNVLSLFVSKDLRSWYHAKTLMTDNQGMSFADSVRMTGFQYPDWRFDGEDIIYIVRTAYQGARNYHDANRITFGRVLDYKDFTPDSVLAR